MGVLCDFSKVGRWLDLVNDGIHYVTCKNEESNIPDKEVLKWAGITAKTASKIVDLNDDENDDGDTTSFEEIADWIDENL